MGSASPDAASTVGQSIASRDETHPTPTVTHMPKRFVAEFRRLPKPSRAPLGRPLSCRAVGDGTGSARGRDGRYRYRRRRPEGVGRPLAQGEGTAR
ncbi:hypothetical protein BRD13_07605 [Halobacteriales archaeon SW_5_70_135]|nr:MAG: hypothetical protein BRD13_07605 [Halobacteriales archaeon SW_5_70_135]